VFGCRLLCAPESALDAYAAARDGTALPTFCEQDAFARVRLSTALRARIGGGCVCCRTRLKFSACLIFAGGVRSCAAADCSARPKGRWKRTLPHRTALLCLTALLAGKSAAGVSCRIKVVFFAFHKVADAYVAHPGGESFDVDRFAFMLTSPHVSHLLLHEPSLLLLFPFLLLVLPLIFTRFFRIRGLRGRWQLYKRPRARRLVGGGCQGVPASGYRAVSALVAVADARAATGGVATTAGVAASRVGVAEADVKVSEVTATLDDEGGSAAMAAVAAAAVAADAAAAATETNHAKAAEVYSEVVSAASAADADTEAAGAVASKEAADTAAANAASHEADAHAGGDGASVVSGAAATAAAAAAAADAATAAAGGEAAVASTMQSAAVAQGVAVADADAAASAAAASADAATAHRKMHAAAAAATAAAASLSPVAEAAEGPKVHAIGGGPEVEPVVGVAAHLRRKGGGDRRGERIGGDKGSGNARPSIKSAAQPLSPPL